MKLSKDLLPALLILVALYVAYCSGAQQGKRTGRAQQADSVAAVIRDSNARYAARFAQRDLENQRIVTRQAGEIQRLKGRVIPRDTLVQLVPDSAGVVETQLALRDSVIADLDSTVTLYQAMVRDRDELIRRREQQIAALETARNAWKTAARPNLFQKVGRGLPWVAAGVIAGVALSR